MLATHNRADATIGHVSKKTNASHVPYIGGSWGMDWGSLGDRSGIILGWFDNGFVRFWDGVWLVYH